MLGHSHQHSSQCSHSEGSNFHQNHPEHHTRHSHSHQTNGANGSCCPPAPATPIPMDIFEATKQRDHARFKEFLDLGGPAILHSTDRQGYTLAHWAAQADNVPVLRILWEQKVEVDQPTPDEVGMHPIHWACASGSLNALHFLVSVAGIDANRVDPVKRRSPTLVAAQYGHPLLVLYLIKKGADVKLVDADGDTALHWAAYKGNEQVVSIFQYLGLKIDAPDNFGQTPLHLAAMRGNVDTVKYLVNEVDSDLSVKDAKGRTPLELAKVAGRREVARFLSSKATVQRWNPLGWWETSRLPFYIVISETIFAYYLYWTLLSTGLEYSVFNWLCVAIANLGMNGFLYMAHYSEAGYVSKTGEHRREYEYAIGRIGEASSGEDAAVLAEVDISRPLCHTCHVQRPLRSKHCRMCKRCVFEFDHHCPYIDNCVGRKNYPFFFGYLFFAIFSLCQLDFSLFLYMREYGWTWSMIILWVNYLIFVLFVANMLGFHLYLMLSGVTTNEMINFRKYEYMRDRAGRIVNRFDRGWLQNIRYKLIVPRDDRGSGSERETSLSTL